MYFNRSVFLVCLGILTAEAFGCGDKKNPQGAARSSQGLDEETGSGERPKLFTNYSVHTDLLQLSHLADIEQGGLIIAFGSASHNKYTLGGWRTGWGKNTTIDGASVTYTEGTASRLYFPLWKSRDGLQDKPDGIVMRFRLKAIGTKIMSIYLNNKQLPTVTLNSSGGFSDYDVVAPSDVIERGENYLLLRFGGTAKVETADVAVAMQSVTVFPGASLPVARANIAFKGIVDDVKSGKSVRKALAASVPSRMSWTVQVPVEGKSMLGFGVGADGEVAQDATAVVTIASVNGAGQEVHRSRLSGKWVDKVVSLEPWAGQVVRIELAADGGPGTGRVAWSFPAILQDTVQAEEAPKPAKNVVVVLIDTLRADHLKPFNPRTRVKTPALDQLAKESVVFEEAQSTENWTKPSVAAVLTGLYPSTHGAKTFEAKLPQGASMVSELLKESGFKTASFIANGYVSDKFGFDQGWDSYTNYIRDNKNTQAETLFNDAGNWIEQHKTERFFAYVHTIDPHVPYDPPEQFLKMYDDQEYTGAVSPRQTASLLEKAKKNPPQVTFTDRDRQRLLALYDGEISYHDVYLGKFIERLKSIGVYDDTVIVVTADHGEEFDDHGSYGHGHSTFQELLHVPLMVRVPGLKSKIQRVGLTTSTVHVTPTVLDLMGVAVPDVVEGHSLLPQIMGVKSPHFPVAFSDFLDDRRVIRAGRWKLVVRGSLHDWYDLERDPKEREALGLSKHPIALRYCRALLGQFLGSENRRLWWRDNKVANARSGLKQENADMDEKTREQLKALGYGN